MVYKPKITVKKGAYAFLAVGVISLLVELLSTGQLEIGSPALAAGAVSIANMVLNYLKHKDD